MGVGIGCVYIFLKEVNPFGRSPQAIFDHAVDRLIIKDEVCFYSHIECLSISVYYVPHSHLMHLNVFYLLICSCVCSV